MSSQVSVEALGSEEFRLLEVEFDHDIQQGSGRQNQQEQHGNMAADTCTSSDLGKGAVSGTFGEIEVLTHTATESSEVTEMDDWRNVISSLPKDASKKERENLETEEARFYYTTEWSPGLAERLLDRFPKVASSSYSETSSLSQLLNQYKGWELLRRGEEIGLAKTMESGDEASAKLADESLDLMGSERRELAQSVRLGEDAKFVFAMSNIGLVTKAAQRAYNFPLRPNGVEMTDLIEEGNVGLTIAIGKFDWRLGNKFSTMAKPWIERDIKRYLHERAALVRVPDQRMVPFESEFKRAKQKLEAAQAGGDAEGLTETDFMSTDAFHILQVRTPLSLNSPMPFGTGEDEDMEYVEAFSSNDDTEEIVLDSNEKEQHLNTLANAMNNLDERDHQITVLRYGLDGNGVRSFRIIGEELQVSPDFAQRAIKRIEKQLREEFSLQN
jgi:RNA polymerase primary sigma factor